MCTITVHPPLSEAIFFSKKSKSRNQEYAQFQLIEQFKYAEIKSYIEFWDIFTCLFIILSCYDYLPLAKFYSKIKGSSNILWENIILEKYG